jgi:starvation-inducible outer membrane lipoprotein
MKHKLTSFFALIALMLALSSPSPAAGRHPQIEDALRALHNAKEHLEHAAHDFGGHRVDAIRAIDEADRQLRICMQY